MLGAAILARLDVCPLSIVLLHGCGQRGDGLLKFFLGCAEYSLAIGTGSYAG